MRCSWSIGLHGIYPIILLIWAICVSADEAGAFCEAVEERGISSQISVNYCMLQFQMDRVDKLVALLAKRVDDRRRMSATPGSNR